VTAISFRKDGKLIATGELSGYVQIFEVKKKIALRQYQKHTKAVHAITFIPEKAAVVTGSDDLSVKSFDMTTSQITRNFGNIHTDYVRKVIGVPKEPELVLSGSYDCKINLLDFRLTKKPVSIFDHTVPVESLEVFSSGNSFISVGGTLTTIWDIRKEDEPLFSFNTNLKTVTTVRMLPEGTKFLTGSLDQHIKIYDIKDTPKLIHQLKYPAGIMSFDLTTTLSHIAVGMNDGQISIKSRTLKSAKDNEEEDVNEEYKYPKIDSSDKIVVRNYKYYNRGVYDRPENFDVEYQGERKIKLQEYDRYLKKFQYKNALQAALETGRSDTIYSLIEELILRNELVKAVDTTDHEEIQTIFDYLTANISNPRYTSILLPLAELLIDKYAKELFGNKVIRESYEKLQEKIEKELSDQKQMMNILGALDFIIDANSFSCS